MKVVMIGAGYVGLTTGACLAKLGHSVTCVDTDAARIQALAAGATPIYEPGLDDLIRKNRDSGRLDFSADTKGPAPRPVAEFCDDAAGQAALADLVLGDKRLHERLARAVLASRRHKGSRILRKAGSANVGQPADRLSQRIALCQPGQVGVAQSRRHGSLEGVEAAGTRNCGAEPSLILIRWVQLFR